MQKETTEVEIAVRSEQAIARLKEIQQETAKLKKSLDQMGQDSPERKAAQKQLKDLGKEAKELRKELSSKVQMIIDGKAASSSLNELIGASRTLHNELKKLPHDSEEFVQKSKRFQEINAQIDQLNNRMRGTGGLFQTLKKELGSVGMMAAGYVGFQAMTSSIRNLIGQNARLSDTFADVAKTSGLSMQQVNELYDELGDLNTRTARKELMALAVEGGKLGKETVKDLKEFVRQADIINVALGDALGEGAVTKIGKISDIFGVSMLQIGSAVNEVANKSKASEGWQVEFISNISGVATTTKIAANELLGYGSVLENLGLTQEVSSTAFKNFLIEFVRDAEKFGKVAGFAKGEMRKLMNEEGTNEAFIQFLEKLKEGSVSSQDMLKKLQALGIDGAKGATVFLTLAENIGKVREQQSITSAAIKDGSSVIKEFETRNENFAAKLEKVGKALHSAFVNSAVMTGLENMVNWMAKLVEVKVSESLEQERLELGRLQLKLNDVNLKHEDRVKLINQLKEQYPGFLGYLNAETVTNGQLNQALERVNQSLLNRIVIQRKQEELDAQNEVTADKLEAKLKAEEHLQKILFKAKEKYHILIKDGLSLSEQAVSMQEEINKRFVKTQSIGDDAFSSVLSINSALSKFTFTTQKFDEQNSISNKIMEDKNKAMEQLGMKTIDASEAQKRYANKTVEELQKLANIEAGAYEELQRRKAQIDAEAAAKAANKLKEPDKEEEDKLDKQKKAHAKALEELEVFVSKVKALRAEMNASDDSPMMKEVFEVRKKFTPLIDDAKKGEAAGDPNAEAYKAERIRLEEELGDAINKIADKYDQQYIEDRERAKQQITESLMTDDERELQTVSDKYDKLIALAKKFGLDTIALEQAKADHVGQIIDKQHKHELTAEQIARNKKIKAKEDEVKALLGIMGNFLEAADALSELAGTHAQTAAGIQKAVTLVQIGIDTASAISSLMRGSEMAAVQMQMLGVPYPIAKATVYAQGFASILTNVALAKKTLSNADAPKAEQGRIAAGPSHTDGGLKVWNPKTNLVDFEMEGGELVGSKKFVQKNPGLTQIVLDAGKKNGVVDVNRLMQITVPEISMQRMRNARIRDRFEYGGIAGNNFRPSVDGKGAVNILEAGNSTTYSTEGKGAVNIMQGNSTTHSTEGKGAVNKGEGQAMAAAMRMMAETNQKMLVAMERMEKTNAKLHAQLEQGIEADLVYTKLEQKMKRLNKVRGTKSDVL